jgi:hypothetical protein
MALNARRKGGGVTKHKAGAAYAKRVCKGWRAINTEGGEEALRWLEAALEHFREEGAANTYTNGFREALSSEG